MVVLNDICEICNKNTCNAIHFQQNFDNWTSGNNDIDKLIQDSQLSAHNSSNIKLIQNYQLLAHNSSNSDIARFIQHPQLSVKKALEWIPYDRFYNIIAKV